MDLTPASDTWVDTVRLEPKIIQREGNFAATVAEAERSFGGFDPQTGLTSTLWGGWQTVWTGTETNVSTQTRGESLSTAFREGLIDQNQFRRRRRRRENSCLLYTSPSPRDS